MNTIKKISLNSNEEMRKFFPLNSLIISEDKTLRHSSDYKVLSVKELCENIIKKSPILVLPYILSAEESIYLIHSITKELFKNHAEFYNLTKTNMFSKTLYQLFEKFFHSNIDTMTLSKIIESEHLDNKDKQRLNLILETFNLYNETLEKQNLLDQNNIYSFGQNILKQFPQHLKIAQQNCQNILIDEKINLTKQEKFFLEKIGTNIINIEIKDKTSNPLATCLSKKYLKKDLNIKETSPKIKIYQFNDIVDEAKYIAEDIIKKTNEENYLLSDFTVALNNPKSISIFNDILNQYNIPTNYEKIDDSFQYFLMKLNQYTNICSNLQLIGNDFKLYKTQTEELYEEINLNFENIISEELNNQYTKDLFIQILQNSKENSLINCVESNLNLLNNNDKDKITKELKKIKNLQNLYKNNDYNNFITAIAKEVNTLSSTAQSLIAKLIKKITSLNNILIKTHNSQLNQDLFIKIINTPINNVQNFSDNVVKIIQIKNEQYQYSKVLYLPDLTDNSIPTKNNELQYISNDANEKISNKIKILDKNFEEIIPSTQNKIKESAKNLINLLTLNQEEIYLSTHYYEDKKQIIPSIFFQYLCTIIEPEEIKIPEINNNFNTQLNYQNISQKEKTNIINEDEIIKLSASAISTFQTCPKKFYFSNLLGLKSKGTFATSYGTIVHAIFELFNQKYLNSYTKKTILNLSTILFNSNLDPQSAIISGFSQYNIDLVAATDLLSLEEMKLQFEQAIEELEKNNFFAKIPDKIICEKSFNFCHPLIKNVIFNGRIDAIYKFGDKYIIIDYKTGANKPELNYLISENGVTFKTPKGKETNVENKQNEFEYQIPIYYFACKYSDDLKEIGCNVETMGLMYIRPKNKNNGYKEDLIQCSSIEEFENLLIKNLDETIINKIKNKNYFEAKPNEIICNNCPFKELCKHNPEEEDND